MAKIFEYVQDQRAISLNLKYLQNKTEATKTHDRSSIVDHSSKRRNMVYSQEEYKAIITQNFYTWVGDDQSSRCAVRPTAPARTTGAMI